MLFSTVCVALMGPFKDKARTFEQLYTPSIATESNILVLNMSLSDDKSLLRYFNFLMRTQVEALGQ